MLALVRAKVGAVKPRGAAEVGVAAHATAVGARGLNCAAVVLFAVHLVLIVVVVMVVLVDQVVAVCHGVRVEKKSYLTCKKCVY